MNNDYNKNLLDRFLKYISFETTSLDDSDTIPSSLKELDLAKYLYEELQTFKVCSDIVMDKYGYVYAYIKGNNNSNNTIGLIAHMDTSNEVSGKDIKPSIHLFNGEDIIINKELDMRLSINTFKSLVNSINHYIVTTDGTTLLGADDKAGIAIIMTLIEELCQDSSILHPNIIITFTPDEEIGNGTIKFNYDYYKNRNCNIAYTIDGDDPQIINFENFNAASAVVNVKGKSIHPGDAKDQMINSMLVAYEFIDLLPKHMVPEATCMYEGFNHLTDIVGNVSNTKLSFIIRNHDLTMFNKQKELFIKAKDYINAKYNNDIVSVEIHDSYYNMKDLFENNMEIVENAKKALLLNNITPIVLPIRGGTDGARLSFEGILTPNLGNGGNNFHGYYEYLDLNMASNMINILKSLLSLY